MRCDIIAFTGPLDQTVAVSIPLFHLLATSTWDVVREGVTYAPDSLRTEGFVHLSTAEQVAGSAALFFAEVDDLTVLRVELSADDPHLRWEPGSGPRGTEDFPHYHAPLPVSSITSASKFRSHGQSLGWES